MLPPTLNSATLHSFDRLPTSNTESNARAKEILLESYTQFRANIKTRTAETPISWHYIKSAGALPYYVLVAVVESIDLIANKIRVDTDNFFNKTSAALIISLFCINAASFFFPGREIAVSRKIAKKLEPHANNSNLVHNFQSNIQKGISARKVQIGMCLFGSALNIAISGVVWYSGNHNITLSPITPNATWEAIFAVAGNVIASTASIPFYSSIAIHAFKECIGSAKTWLHTRRLLSNISDDLAHQIILNTIKTHQRPMEYAFRCLSNAYGCLALGLLSTWGTFQFCGLLPGGENPEFWSQTWVNALEPILNKALLAMAIIAITYGTLKLIRSSYNALNRSSLVKIIETTQAGTPIIELPHSTDEQTESLLNQDRQIVELSITDYLKSEPRFAIEFIVSYIIKTPDAQLTEFLTQLGVPQNNINEIQEITPGTEDTPLNKQKIEAFKALLAQIFHLADLV